MVKELECCACTTDIVPMGPTLYDGDRLLADNKSPLGALVPQLSSQEPPPGGTSSSNDLPSITGKS